MTAIVFDAVSKRFTIHHQRARTLREAVLGRFEGRRDDREDLWALRDVSFGVEPGDCFGIIGPNGSGKSTALKLMTNILAPTSGRVQVSGRVSPLLELGAGFHPDLTGRENIFLNGSVLGMDRAAMRRRFDEIVAFAELERFIDMPVKHYSSGMYMRLGFAIAINVDPDILVTDEVLAVGDQSFQTKCMERIGQMKQEGITIVFVSHGLDAVRGLCARCAWLDQGRLAACGPTGAVIDAYMASVAEREESRLAAAPAQGTPTGRWGTGEAAIVDVSLLDSEGRDRHVFRAGEQMRARIRYTAHTRVTRPVFGLAIYRSDGCHVNGPNTRFSGLELPHVEGTGAVDYVVDSLPLLAGSYDVSAAIYDFEGVHAYDHQQRLYHFQVHPGSVREQYGFVYMASHWEHHPAEGPVTSSPHSGEIAAQAGGHDR